jgi:hypothetical protein
MCAVTVAAPWFPTEELEVPNTVILAIASMDVGVFGVALWISVLVFLL